MALAKGDIWISRWDSREIGIWDPATDTFTVQFDLDTVAPELRNAGALAYDPVNEIMWVGTQGGLVTPFSLTGTQLGAGFQPFGNINDTIDGLTFLGEVTEVPPTEGVPEPTALSLAAVGVFVAGWYARHRRSRR
jgi:hypothetical protein